MKNVLTCIFFLLCKTYLLHAQPACSFAVVISDSSDSRPIAGALVLLKSKATGIAGSAVSGARGSALFTDMTAGSYLLTVSHAGYKTFVLDSIVLQADTVSFSVRLSREEKIMQGVTVSPRQAYITQTADQVTINVAASPVNAGSTAYEAILRAPGVIELNNSLQFRGQGIVVYINNRPANLSGEDLKQYLSSIPANTIEKIEIMLHPSAKYDAQGSGIVMNLKLAKSKQLGTNGSVTQGVGTGHWLQYQEGVTLNYRTRKLNVYAGYDFMHNRQYTRNQSRRIISPDMLITEDSYEIRDRNNHNYRLGLDGDISQKTSAGFLLRGLFSEQEKTITNRSILGDTASLLTTTGPTPIKNPALNLYYKTTTGKGNDLQLNIDWFQYNKKGNDHFITRFFDDEGNVYQPDFLLRSHAPSMITVKAATADYSGTAKKSRWETGLKASTTTTDNDMLWEYQDNGQWMNDVKKTNHFVYNETIYAAYFNYNRNIKNWELQSGLRAELTYTLGRSYTLHEMNKQHYLDFFPNAGISYTINAANILNLSYKKTIYRFGYNIINPFIIYQSRYSYYQGNPYIQPMYYHHFSLSHTCKQVFNMSLRYTHINGMISQVAKQDTVNHIVVNSYENLSSSHGWSCSGSYAQSLLKGRWTINHAIQGIYFHYHDPQRLKKAHTTTTLLYNMNHLLQLQGGYTIEISGNYISPMVTGTTTFKSRTSLNAGASRSIFKSKTGKLAICVTDLLNTLRYDYDVLSYDVYSKHQNKNESRFMRLTFTWLLGNQRVKETKVRKTGADDAWNRIEAK